MTDPHFIPYTAAALMIGISLYCVGRVLLARRSTCRSHVDVNVSHALMGVGMAGMLVPSLNAFPIDAGLAIFSALAAWFLAGSIRFVARNGIKGTYVDKDHGVTHPLIHAVMAGAMIYMYSTTPTGGIAEHAQSMAALMSADHAAGPAVVTLGFVVVLLASAVMQLNSIGRLSAVTGSVVGASLAGAGPIATVASTPKLERPRLEVICHVAMCVTMVYMLLLMI